MGYEEKIALSIRHTRAHTESIFRVIKKHMRLRGDIPQILCAAESKTRGGYLVDI